MGQSAGDAGDCNGAIWLLSLEAQNTGSKAFFPGDSADADFSGGWVFPEGTKPMVQFTQPNQMNEFQRISHLALRAVTRCKTWQFTSSDRLFGRSQQLSSAAQAFEPV